jgi:glutamate racemase
MKNRFIAVFDSGIGGISVLGELIKAMPNERFIYFGDNKNAPYGCKTERHLLELTMDNIFSVLPFGIKAIVFGCNTISTTIFHRIAYFFPDIKFFGIFPPVEINLLHKRKTLLLCTPNTAKSFISGSCLTILPLENLACEIEQNMFSLDRVDVHKNLSDAVEKLDNINTDSCLIKKDHFLSLQNLKMIIDHRLHYFDVIILGCTHYFFVSKKISDHFRPLVILGGEKFTARRVKMFLGQCEKHKIVSKNQLIFFGENALVNYNFFNQVFPQVKISKKIVKNL